MKHPPLAVCSLIVCITPLALTACGDSNSDPSAAKAPEFEPDTSYLDQLAQDEGIATKPEQQEQEPTEIDQTQIRAPEKAPEEKTYADEKRTWIPEEGSRSIFGKSRDRAVELGQKIQDSTRPTHGLANTTYDEEYAQAAGFAWDMPESWRMAVPGAAYFAEMFISNPLGNASVVFSKQTGSIADIRRELESTITPVLGSAKAESSTREVMGYPVTIFDIEGTYIDPAGKGSRNESPFYAIHAAVIELPTTKVLIKMWGPQDTVHQSTAKFDAMIEKMYEK